MPKRAACGRCSGCYRSRRRVPGLAASSLAQRTQGTLAIYAGPGQTAEEIKQKIHTQPGLASHSLHLQRDTLDLADQVSSQASRQRALIEHMHGH